MVVSEFEEEMKLTKEKTMGKLYDKPDPNEYDEGYTRIHSTYE